MPTKYVKISQAPIKEAIIDRYVKYVKSFVVPQLEDFLESLYEKTFEGWRGGGDSGSSLSPRQDKPEVRIKSRVKVSRNGIIKIVIHSVAVDQSGQPHLLYFWLDFGTKSYQHTTRSASFPVRSRKRWYSGKNLSRGPRLSDSEVYTGEWAHINPYQVRKGIRPSGITSIIATHFKAEVRRNVYPMTYKGFRRIDLSSVEH